MGALAVWGLDRDQVWGDEGVTLQMAHRSLPQIWHLTRHIDAVHGLYYVLMHFVLAPHPGEVSLRLPSVAGAMAATALVTALGTRLAGARVGLWAGLLFAVTPFVGRYAQEGRSYALVAAGAAAATLLLVRAVDGTRHRTWAAYAVTLAVAGYLHELSVLVVAAHLCTLAWARVPWRVWRPWLVSATAAVAALVPLVWVSRGQSDQVAWLRPPGWEQAGYLLEAFAGPEQSVRVVVVLLSVLALCTAGPRRGRLTLKSVALPLAVVPPAVLFAVSQHQPIYFDRYVLCALAGIPLLAAAGADLLGRQAESRGSAATRLLVRRAVTATGLLAVAAALVAQLPFHRQDRDPSRHENLTAVAALAARCLKPGDAVVFLPSPGARRPAAAFPDAFAGTRDIALARHAGDAGTLYDIETDAPAFARRMAGVDHVWAVTDTRWVRPGRQPPTALERAKQHLLDTDFVLAEEHRTHSGTLRLYTRRPAAS